MTRPATFPAVSPLLVPAFLVSALLAAGCGGNGASQGGPPGGGSPPPPEVTVTTIEPKTVAVPYGANGRLEGSREVEVRARVSGILLKRRFAEGGAVGKGQILFVIDPAPYKAEVQAAEAGLAEAQARLAQVEREVTRLTSLLAAGAVSQKAYDDAVSAVEFARAAKLSTEARLDQAKLNLAYTQVEAPISGVTSRAEHSEGSLVEPGDNGLLTRISQVRPLWVRFSLPDQTLLALKRGLASKRMTSPGTSGLEVELVLADGGVHPERGRVNFRDTMVDSATGSVELRAELPNSAGDLLPGQFVRVKLLGVERPAALLVPQRAVQQGQAGKFVFVVGPDGKAEQRDVQVGDWSGQDWVIESGVAAGERVIVDGTVKVQPGAAVTVVEATGAGS